MDFVLPQTLSLTIMDIFKVDAEEVHICLLVVVAKIVYPMDKLFSWAMACRHKLCTKVVVASVYHLIVNQVRNSVLLFTFHSISSCIDDSND